MIKSGKCLREQLTLEKARMPQLKGFSIKWQIPGRLMLETKSWE